MVDASSQTLKTESGGVMEKFRAKSYDNTVSTDVESISKTETAPDSNEESADTVTVWETENCQMCRMTKRQLGKLAIDFTTELLSDHPEAVERFRNDGHMTAPVVESPIGTWSGFRSTKIEELAEYYSHHN